MACSSMPTSLSSSSQALTGCLSYPRSCIGTGRTAKHQVSLPSLKEMSGSIADQNQDSTDHVAILNLKVAGAAAHAGLSLGEIAAEAKRASESVGTMGVALSVCTLPGEVTSNRIGPGLMELGLGIHGEPGVAVTDIQPVGVVVSRVLKQILSVPVRYGRKLTMRIVQAAPKAMHKNCIFAPFFPSDDPQKFANVHKVFGASNVSKMLQELPVHQSGDAVSSLVYEANARIRDPVYGCVGAISYLQSQVSQLQIQLAVAQTEILCIQMQQESPMAEQQVLEIDHEKSLMHNNFSSISRFMDFGSSSNVVVQEPHMKRESLWT